MQPKKLKSYDKVGALPAPIAIMNVVKRFKQ